MSSSSVDELPSIIAFVVGRVILWVAGVTTAFGRWLIFGATKMIRICQNIAAVKGKTVM